MYGGAILEVKITRIHKNNNKYNVQKDNLFPLSEGAIYDFDVVGICINYSNSYELIYDNGEKVKTLTYPCGSGIREDGKKYSVFADSAKQKFVLFADVEK